MPTRSEILLPFLLAMALTAAAAAQRGKEVVDVFDGVVIHRQVDLDEVREADGLTYRDFGLIVERRMQLPAKPAAPADTRGVWATISIEPLPSTEKPNDPWTRLGTLTVLDDDGDEVELARFVTPYGAPAEYELDLTAMAPLLHDTCTIRGAISSYGEGPTWKMSVTLTYALRDAGVRRPGLVETVFGVTEVDAAEPMLEATVTIPEGMISPRLRIISTGHATDGRGANEFVSCPHVLRIDGEIVALWRPWTEGSGRLRRLNPWAGRRRIDGRQLWASDYDRAGWQPSQLVQPLYLPLPQLTAGRHEVSLEIEGIRPAPEGEQGPKGYFVVSAIVVADLPWPVE